MSGEKDKPDGPPEGLWADRADEEPTAETAGAAMPPAKVCPACSVIEHTAGAFCPHCATAYDRTVGGRRRRPSRRVAVIALIVTALLGGAGAAGAMVVQHDKEEKAKHARDAKVRRAAEARQRAAAAAAEADEAAEEARRAQEEQDAARREIRRSLVKDLRKSITKDARSRVADGLLDGPIYGTQCDPIGGGNASNLDAHTGRYSCLAYNKKTDDGTIQGYGFTATVNFDKFTYQWHLGNE
jgi:hypothetical protein